MVTLISVYSGGRCIGRCDAKCYNAKGPKCTCCCGGVNHGKGWAQSTLNTEEMGTEPMLEWAKAEVGDDGDYEVRIQGLLFAPAAAAEGEGT